MKKILIGLFLTLNAHASFFPVTQISPTPLPVTIQTPIPVTYPTGQAPAVSSQSVTLSNENVQDLFITGQAAQTATINNILPATAVSTGTDLTGYRSALVQVVSTGTGGTFIFEGSNDPTNNYQTIPVYNQVILTGTPITTAITAANTQIGYYFPTRFRYIRLRIATTITGGSIQAISQFSQAPFSPAVMQVAQTTIANLNTTSTISSGTITTVGTVTNGNLGMPALTTDVASAAIATTTTTAAVTPSFGTSYLVQITTTVVSGTLPTLDIQIQESTDGGTNWFGVYDFPRITATGSIYSPHIPNRGNRVRYVQTVSGTTPSFTRSIGRMQASYAGVTPLAQMYDRTVTLTSLNSTTATLNTKGTKNAFLEVNIGVTTIAPALQIQCSQDGTNFVNIGSPLTAVASSTVSATINNVSCDFMRAIVTTAGTVTTAGYVLVRGF